MFERTAYTEPSIILTLSPITLCLPLDSPSLSFSLGFPVAP